MSTQICVSLACDTTTDAIDRMVDLAPVADLFEIRGDAMAEPDLLTLLRARVKPLLFTCRPPALGGRFPGDEEQRRLRLLEAVRRGFDYVDVELESHFLDVAMEKAGNGLVVSHHDFAGMPGDLGELYREICDHGADIAKIAVTPRTFTDVARLVAFADEVAAGGPVPLVPLAMGPLGVFTRVLAGRWKAPFTFASSGPGLETAPGQLSAAALAQIYRVREITPATRVYGLLGTDVLGSPSPALHNRVFAALGEDAVYVPLQVDALAPFLEALPHLRLSGFAVTRPFKHEIVPFVAELEPSAEAAGSVNTVVVDDARLRGSSTDGLGVVVPLRQRLDLARRSILILGAGGAARAAALALVREGAYVKVLARRAAEALAVARAIDCGSGALSTLPQLAWDVIVNATPVGSAGQAEATLVPAELHRKGSVVFDMVYDPAETRLLREARAAGCTVIGGLEMLLAQAAPQVEAWTGKPAPLEVMREVFAS